MEVWGKESVKRKRWKMYIYKKHVIMLRMKQRKQWYVKGWWFYKDVRKWNEKQI